MPKYNIVEVVTGSHGNIRTLTMIALAVYVASLV